ncbi:MAG: GNAT family N-acetyltransferase [Chloroflexi bacterium]|nr:GNAT family N-acetyltransferase [Chloroflexota bacterium]
MIQIQAVEDNILTYYRGIARSLGGQFIEQDQVAWFTTGRRSLLRFNAVLRTVADSPQALRRVADPILDLFLSQKLPFFWAAWPPDAAPGLADYLSATGLPFLRYNMPAMARPLDDLPPVAPPNGVEIVRVRTERDQTDWLDVHMVGFEEPEAARPDFGQYLASSLAEPQSGLEHFVARWRGEPCAISTLLAAPLATGIYHVTTLPAYRGRGLGKALTLAAMQSARRAGYVDAILFATPSGYPLYQRLGFEMVATAELFGWNGGRDA